jgi:hypothetical protein
MSKECVSHHYACDCREEVFSDKIKELETQNKIMSNDLDGAGNELFIQEGKIKELEAKLKVAVEALRLIAEEYYGSSISMNEARMALEKIKGGG